MVIYVSGLQIGSEGIRKVVKESVDVWTGFSIHNLLVVAVESYFRLYLGNGKSYVELGMYCQ